MEHRLSEDQDLVFRLLNSHKLSDGAPVPALELDMLAEHVVGHISVLCAL